MGQTGVDGCGPLCCGCGGGAVGAVGDEGVRYVYAPGGGWLGGDGNGFVVFDNRRRARVVGWIVAGHGPWVWWQESDLLTGFQPRSVTRQGGSVMRIFPT